jgi:hypothetical protein
LTVTQTPQLANSRYVGATNGLTITDGGAQGLFNISTTGALLSLVNSGTGFQVKTDATTLTARSFTVSGTGLSIINGDGVSGNPVISLSGAPLNLANLSANGLLTITTAGGVGAVTLQGTTNQITVTYGNAVGGFPTVALADNPVLPGVASATLPAGSTANRPVSAVNGMIRYNTDTSLFEGYLNGAWSAFASSSGVTSVATGTGLTGGPITSTGTISIDSTVATLTGTQTLTNKTISGASNTLSNIANSSLTNNSVTYNGVAVALGASGTITAENPNALTIGTGLSGTSYTGAAAVTIAIDSTVATLTGAQTLTNKTISGASNTLSNIPNSALSNSTISGVALGSNLFNLTAGTGISFSTGTTYNGSAAITINSTGSSGTVTSVAQSFTGGLISVGGSPITSSGTLALTVAGTSGGVPYFSSGTTWATSAALAANAIVLGGGAGAAPATTTTGTGVVTALGVNTGSAGAFVVNGGALGTPSSGTVTNLTGTASININGTVGATTASTGAFTTLSASSTVSGTGFSTYLASPPAIGGTAAAAITGTTITANTQFSGPLNGTVGATTASTGAFTTVSATGVITSTLATGTAPFTVASTTQVANLNAATAGTATNATNVNLAAGTGATNYIPFSATATGNQPLTTNTLLTYNYTNNALTAGITGGTF